MDNQNTVNDTIIAIKKIVLEQLQSSKDLNIEYKLCLDFLHHRKDNNYKKLIINRINKSDEELYKYSQDLIHSVSKWLYDYINSLTEYQQSDLLFDPIKMDALLKETNKYIGSVIHDKYDRPIFSCQRNQDLY